MKIAWQESGSIRWVIIILSTSSFLCSKQWKIPDAKSRCGQREEEARKPASMANDQDEEQKGGHPRGAKRAKNSPFAALMDICHLKNPELEPQFQKYKGRVVLPRDIVEDDSGSNAVFTEQGSSASQMTAAKVMGVISRLPGAQDKQLMQYQQNGGRFRVIENSKVRVSR